MNKYKRQHGGSNTSPGIYWILFAGIVAVIVYKIVEFRRKIKEVETMQKQPEYKIYQIGDTAYLLPDTSVLIQRK